MPTPFVVVSLVESLTWRYLVFYFIMVLIINVNNSYINVIRKFHFTRCKCLYCSLFYKAELETTIFFGVHDMVVLSYLDRVKISSKKKIFHVFSGIFSFVTTTFHKLM